VAHNAIFTISRLSVSLIIASHYNRLVRVASIRSIVSNNNTIVKSTIKTLYTYEYTTFKTHCNCFSPLLCVGEIAFIPFVVFVVPPFYRRLLYYYLSIIMTANKSDWGRYNAIIYGVFCESCGSVCLLRDILASCTNNQL
jgi:hypothetical protein